MTRQITQKKEVTGGGESSQTFAILRDGIPLDMRRRNLGWRMPPRL